MQEEENEKRRSNALISAFFIPPIAYPRKRMMRVDSLIVAAVCLVCLSTFNREGRVMMDLVPPVVVVVVHATTECKDRNYHPPMSLPPHFSLVCGEREKQGRYLYH